MIVYDSFRSNKVVRHVPLYWSELASKFMTFSNHHIRVAVTGKREDRSIGLGLEIAGVNFFRGENRVMEWFKKSIEKLDKCNLTCEICFLLKTFKTTHLRYHYFLIYPKISVSAIER